MKALICDICGGKLVIEKGGNHAVCESCGMHHSRDRVLEKVQEIRGTVKIKGAVETYSGNAQKEKQIKDAETLLRLKEFDRAEKAFLKLSESYPDDPRGWWGLFRLPLERWIPHEVESLRHGTMLFEYDKPYENCVKYLKNVYSTSKNHSEYINWFKNFLDTRYGKKVHTTYVERGNVFRDKSVWCNGYEIRNCVPDHLSRWLLSWQGYEALEIMDNDEIYQHIAVINEDFEKRVLSGSIIWDEDAPLGNYPALDDVISEASRITAALGDKGVVALLNRSYPFNDYKRYLQRSQHITISLVRAFSRQMYVRWTESPIDYYGTEFRTVRLNEPLTVDSARKLRGVCRHCGGEFSGFFTLRCSRCDNKKDY